MGPQTAAADALHSMKYRGEGEGFREAMNRVAAGLKDSDAHYHEFRKILLDMRFCPGGRIQSAIGAVRQTTAFNCFVSQTIGDSYVEGSNSIMDCAKEAAATMRMGGGIGYDFSTLRPSGALIKKLQSHSSGPMSFMKIFDAVCEATRSSGHRRGAQMGILRVDHPDVEAFVRAKQNSNNLTNFNISVAITDEFMEAALSGKEFDLRFGGTVYRTIDAASLWEEIMRSTWDWAEPGVVFIDRMNEMNNLWYCETIAATNPCSEQPLPPYGACLLGSFNLVKYLTSAGDGQRSAWTFDTAQLAEDIPTVVRAMDNVTDKTKYPLIQQRAEAFSKRRMGLGIMGLANTAEALGMMYGSPAFLEFERFVLREITNGCYRASIELAKEKGSFPLFDEEKYPQSKFIKTLPDDIQDGIKKFGIRNSHLTSIAPTGTIATCADNVSSGIEPVFAFKLSRPINTPTGVMVHEVEDYGSMFLGTRGKLAKYVTAEEHVKVLAVAQEFMDSAVSKTCNVSGNMPWADFKGLYQTAWELKAKGCTTFNDSGKRMALLTDGESNQPNPTMIPMLVPAEVTDPMDYAMVGGSCEFDPATGRRSCE